MIETAGASLTIGFFSVTPFMGFVSSVDRDDELRLIRRSELEEGTKWSRPNRCRREYHLNCRCDQLTNQEGRFYYPHVYYEPDWELKQLKIIEASKDGYIYPHNQRE